MGKKELFEKHIEKWPFSGAEYPEINNIRNILNNLENEKVYDLSLVKSHGYLNKKALELRYSIYNLLKELEEKMKD